MIKKLPNFDRLNGDRGAVELQQTCTLEKIFFHGWIVSLYRRLQ